jgi:serpin B
MLSTTKMEIIMKQITLILTTFAAVLLLYNCSSNPTVVNENENRITELNILRAEGISRQHVTDVSSEDMAALVQGNIHFAFDMYAQLVALRENQGKNVFFSPYSISVALAMTLAGAEGETETEMHKAMHFALAEPSLHKAFNRLDMEMEKAAEKQEHLTLSVVNSLWGEYSYNFRISFLNIMAAQYGAGMNLVDFGREPDPSRLLINKWVEEKTRNRIKDLLPPGSIDPSTTLVLTNAIYFLADWQKQFNPEYTEEKTFTMVDGSTILASQMKMAAKDETVTLPYALNESKTIKAIELAYVGNRFSMVAVMPVDTDFLSFEKNFNAQEFNKIIEGLDSTKLPVSLPRFTFGSSSVSLRKPLQNMGMHLAFGNADFSGIDGTHNLYIDDVFHKAFIEVNEQGTEAAAATAVIIARLTGINHASPSFLANRPFIYLIRDRITGAVLFMGRVMDPTDKGDL